MLKHVLHREISKYEINETNSIGITFSPRHTSYLSVKCYAYLTYTCHYFISIPIRVVRMQNQILTTASRLFPLYNSNIAFTVHARQP